ncbi:uncharacterized protein LOC124885733 [Capsicum annuum]|uniref:uncharacterized protein LOC124885733 n=1 Tax=Capsicum annuum TaxID=4072 RepID=UPI001FB0BFB8|nr:uncharacterized protein LOC124885733 [Capsicum annuum]
MDALDNPGDHSVNATMSNNTSNIGPFEIPFDDKGQLNDAGQMIAILIPPTNGNGVFHVASVMLLMLQMKWLYGGQAYEDTNVHLKNYVENKESTGKIMTQIDFLTKYVMGAPTKAINSITSKAYEDDEEARKLDEEIWSEKTLDEHLKENLSRKMPKSKKKKALYQNQEKEEEKYDEEVVELTEGDTIEVTHSFSAIVDSKIVEKKDDPRAFISPCTIRMHMFEKALCGLSASINLMPFFIYKKLGLNSPTLTSIQILMVEWSIKRPMGILFDILVKVDKCILPTDFAVLDYEMDQDVPIIFGHPFLAIDRAIFDLEIGEIKFRVQEDKVTFKVYKTKKQSIELQVMSMVDVNIEEAKEGGLKDPP